MKLTSKGKCVNIARWNWQGLELVSLQHLEVKAMKRNQQLNRMNILEEIHWGNENSNVINFIKEGKTMANVADRLNSVILLSGVYIE